ncbi:ribonuclease G [Achromatium sp. WMS3]|nr:ribonuclease G [Achromatium sp. WMS3]
MTEELLINVIPPETRVALIEQGMVQEVFIERHTHRGLIANIYNGRICRVLPGMQAAFVDIGLDRAAFLHISDISSGDIREHLMQDQIQGLIHEGDFIVVQVVKDPLGTKGARLTTNISLSSRYLVFMPGINNIGISQKIIDDQERIRLRTILNEFLTTKGCTGGFIARTAAETINADALHNDMEFLICLWESIQQQSHQTHNITLLYEDLPLTLRALRDLVGPDTERIRIDSIAAYQQAQKFVTSLIPNLLTRLELYHGERPLFDLYHVEDEIRKALERKVHLKSGGYLIIDQTEAVTTIDVNTGAFVGHRNLEETIFKTNLEATQAICRQLRLRNLGGIIIIDFIDMLVLDHKQQVIHALEKCLAQDHVQTQVGEVSSLGLVEMTRKRTRESLQHILCETCSCCLGRGFLKTAETTCYEIFRELMREAKQFEVEALLVLAAPEVIERLVDEESTHLTELEDLIGKPIKLQAEVLYTQEQFDVVLI